ncbi:alpha/beta fold hydrolase [Streptomyces sp. BE20]|uniref:alpha/beta fold hydrolase n=1 Tax=unclassified Streptomyces TaxID=2593676 RepID=UPI002E76D2DC|nr:MULTISPECIES: alpha/beta fold hydrolase [unclassified Streptomyces]MED7952769.1 alpha/beta fold hydrolase [Streptomyces sp. BE303]MEE1825633.1 alpha/beta fold hydrolase [Streptomyces sp. BE20]
MTAHRTVDLPELSLAYRESGPADGPPLVLLHALGERATDWDDVLPALAPHHRVYALDLRGHGDSGRPGRYAVELMRDDVLGFLDALGLERVDLLGHSMGGVVAYLVAQERPERVARLVLEDVPAPHPRPASPVPDRPAGPIDFDWAVVKAVKGRMDRPDPRWLERMTAITAPTLVVAGGPASHVPQDRIAELTGLLPDGRAVTVEAGHLVHRTRPAEFVAAVAPFLEPAGS